MINKDKLIEEIMIECENKMDICEEDASLIADFVIKKQKEYDLVSICPYCGKKIMVVNNER